MEVGSEPKAPSSLQSTLYYTDASYCGLNFMYAHKDNWETENERFGFFHP